MYTVCIFPNFLLSAPAGPIFPDPEDDDFVPLPDFCNESSDDIFHGDDGN